MEAKSKPDKEHTAHAHVRCQGTSGGAEVPQALPGALRTHARPSSRDADGTRGRGRQGWGSDGGVASRPVRRRHSCVIFSSPIIKSMNSSKSITPARRPRRAPFRRCVSLRESSRAVQGDPGPSPPSLRERPPRRPLSHTPPSHLSGPARGGCRHSVISDWVPFPSHSPLGALSPQRRETSDMRDTQRRRRSNARAARTVSVGVNLGAPSVGACAITRCRATGAGACCGERA